MLKFVAGFLAGFVFCCLLNMIFRVLEYHEKKEKQQDKKANSSERK